MKYILFNKFVIFIVAISSFYILKANTSKLSFREFVDNFIENYNKLNIPLTVYDYRDYFKAIPSLEIVKRQEVFFNKQKNNLKSYNRSSLDKNEKIDFDHLQYEIEFNLERIELEKDWISNGRIIPEGGLYTLHNHKKWYSYFIKKFTSLPLTPEEIMEMGKREVTRVQKEIKSIQLLSGFPDSSSFYNYLKSEVFTVTNSASLLGQFQLTDKAVRKNLKSFIGDIELPEVYPMEWPDSGPNTPPGMYLNHEQNNFGKDVFQYNYFESKFNKRAIEWLYMHEAIPGHHLQFSMREANKPNALQEQFLYPGNFEGWACYVEYEGKELGLYKDLYSYLGKWEWDLVRSARLVIDAGIHNYGWSRAQALAYWKQNIPGQDDISEREVTRVTNWTAQALSYKVGADCIFQLRDKLSTKYGKDFNIVKFNRCYLSFGLRPLSVIKVNLESEYSVQ